jgi:hypothetical protein
MKYYKPIILAIFLSVLLIQEKGWRGIVPLHSTRKDVEQLVGTPKATRATTYVLQDGRITVFYSDGICDNGVETDWNVPRDTVVNLKFEPNNRLTIADLKLDMTTYERFNDPHVQIAVHYYSKEEGIYISTRMLPGGEEVQYILYGPASKDYHLRCPQQPTPQE